MPHLAKIHADTGASQASRDAIDVVFQALHHYAGVAIGEHLGYILTSAWTVLIALGMTQSSRVSAWLGWVGLIPALGIFIGVFEEAGVTWAGAITAIGYIAWSLWLIATGVILLAG